MSNSSLNESTQCNHQAQITIIRELEMSRFPVYMVSTPREKNYYAMKVFDFEENKINYKYHHESRFAFLKHPNIVSMVKTIEKHSSLTSPRGSQTNHSRISYILMELAQCDFAKFVKASWMNSSEKLIRTYFHQLVEGVEYLHSQGVYHLDIKPENLLLGQDHQLKITDFDLSYKEGDKRIIGQGTSCYRAPEIKQKSCKNPSKADVYSMGTVLFVLMTGFFPYLEYENVMGYDLMDLLYNAPVLFWVAHERIAKGLTFSEDFKELFISMTREDPLERASVEEVKQSKWYKGPVYNQDELAMLMHKNLNRANYLKK